MTDYADLITESYVQIIAELAKRHGIKKGELAQKVWKNYSQVLASRKWQQIRYGSPKTGKPQDLTLADSFRLAEALGQDPAYILLQAQNMAKEKMKDQNMETDTPNKRGRPRTKE